MSSEEQQGVTFVRFGLLVQRRNIVGKALPLCLVRVAWIRRVAWVGPIDKAKVGCREIEGRRVSAWIILLEYSGHDCVVDVALMGGGPYTGRENRRAEKEGRYKHFADSILNIRWQLAAGGALKSSGGESGNQVLFMSCSYSW
jgi:hypothetical protein